MIPAEAMVEKAIQDAREACSCANKIQERVNDYINEKGDSCRQLEGYAYLHIMLSQAYKIASDAFFYAYNAAVFLKSCQRVWQEDLRLVENDKEIIGKNCENAKKCLAKLKDQMDKDLFVINFPGEFNADN